MTHSRFFVSWTLAFGLLGIAAPVFLMLRFQVFHVPFGDAESFLWPSSIQLMALNTPAPWPTIIFVYGVVIAENVLLYCNRGCGHVANSTGSPDDP
jgi:hypothetical protein